MTEEKTVVVNHRLVHLDLKGAPLCVPYLEQVLPLLKKWGATGLLIEYEDTFPYSGHLSVLVAQHAYSIEEIKHILRLAAENNLIVIPLVQTFGHLEFVLKHEQFHELREVERYPMALCPSNSDAVKLVCSMVDQVIAQHPVSQYFHIGCDEVFHLGMCEKCKQKMVDGSMDKEQIFFSHIRAVASYIKEKHPGITCIVWDDMFRVSELAVISNCGLGELVEPMIWYYAPTFTLPPDLWENLSAVFPYVWVASAFKGATGPRAIITNISFHLDNNNGWIELIWSIKQKFKSVRGITVTGWQRYDHFAVLCELFPHSLPCLALCLHLLKQGSLMPMDIEAISKDLGFTSPIPFNPFILSQGMPTCQFPGSDVYSLMITFVHAESSCNQFFTLDGMIVWMHEYNVKRRFINPVHAEPLLDKALSLLSLLTSIEDRIDKSFQGVFVESVAAEWREVFLSPLLRRLNSFISTARDVLSVKVMPNV